MIKYWCKTCNEEHSEPDEHDMAERRLECDTNGHVKNCVTAYYGSEDYCWCAYCARKISEEEYAFARAKS